MTRWYRYWNKRFFLDGIFRYSYNRVCTDPFSGCLYDRCHCVTYISCSIALHLCDCDFKSLFFKKLNIMTTILSVIGVSIGQWLGFTLRISPDKNFRDIHGLVRILQSRSVNRQETIRKTISQSSMWPQHRRKMQPGSEKLKRWYDRSTNWHRRYRQDLHPRKKVSKINKIQSEKFLQGAWWWKDQRYILQISEHRHLETDFRQS